MKKIIGLVGETGSGKDTFCRYAEKKFKPVFCFRFSQPLTEALGIFFNGVKKEDQQWLATSLRERFGNNILGQAIAKKIKNIKDGLIIVNGIRVEEEFQLIKRLGGKIIYITADPKTRWERVRKRKEKKDDCVSYNKFIELDKAKTEAAIRQIGEKAESRIENNKTFSVFYKQIDETMKNI